MRERIEFFRVAFGTYQTDQMMDAPKVQSTADAIYTTPRLICTGILRVRSTEHGRS